MAQQKTATKASSRRKTSSQSMKKAAARAIAEGGADTVTIDRRRSKARRESDGKDENESTAAPKLERRQKVSRRRQIDPTTCERDYTEQEVEFMNALDDYKRKSGRMFPTCSEVLEVIHSLGYVKLSPTGTSFTPIESIASAKPMPGDVLGWIGSQPTAVSS